MATRYPEASTVIIENSYMDDIVGGAASEERCLALMQEIESMLAMHSFRIKEWIYSGSNSSPVQLKSEGQNEPTNEEKERVLGIQLNPGMDVLELEMHLNLPTASVTKRMMLSVMMKIFDPLGLLTALKVRLKMLMRKVWGLEKKLQWDDYLPEILQREWREIVEELSQSKKIVFPRSIYPLNARGDPVLVMFSDGSIDAFGAVAYVRWELEDCGFEARIVAAKARMAPLKTIDIVRLELCGALLSARLRATIEKELNFQKCDALGGKRDCEGDDPQGEFRI